MSNPTTVIGSPDATENTLTLYGVEKIKTGDVNDEGKIYVTRDYAGERVKYALINDGLVANVGAPDGAVVLNDVDSMDSAKVLSNGYIFVGSEYANEEVTVAAKRLHTEDGSNGNQQTAETHS